MILYILKKINHNNIFPYQGIIKPMPPRSSGKLSQEELLFTDTSGAPKNDKTFPIVYRLK